MKDRENDGKGGRESQANDTQDDRTNRDHSIGSSLFDYSTYWPKALQHPDEQEESRQHVCWNHLPSWSFHDDLEHCEKERDEYYIPYPACGVQSWNCYH